MTGINDIVRQGPQRWERAALNAVRKPNSKGAKLYRTRVLYAHQVAQESTMPGQAYRHTRLGYPVRDWETAGYACSVYCAVMHMQLLVADNTDKISSIISGTHPYFGLEALTGKTTAKCRVCGGRVSR